MDTLSREELRYMVQIRRQPCLSIFLPTHRAGRETEQDRIRLKSLLRDAESRLVAAGLAKRKAREVLAPARPLTEGREFWRYQSDGLALFLASGYFRYFRVPLQLRDFIAVADRFDVTPLLPLWTLEDRFNLLAVSRNRVRLFEGTRFAVNEMDTNSIPKNFNQAIERQVDQSHRTQHTAKPGLPEDLLVYFRSIDRGLRTLLKEQKIPLVLAGVDEALSLYRQINTYEGLLAGGVAGNPDRLSAAELHAKVWETVREHYDQARKLAIRQYVEGADPSRSSSKLTEILPAAYHGRVYYLYIALGAALWGGYDPEQRTVSIHGEAQPGDENLLNLAVVHTILHGGSVYALPLADMPGDSLIASLFRY
jgi:Bacterial archaeo-eukaryotic release factor family 3